MTEDGKGVSNGPASSEMAPQEDGTKVPLTNDDPEVKFTSSNNPPNGDAKIDIGAAPTFSGLSKEELMKYADDPFWVRLRWFLFILFWGIWLLMLVAAIVIIIQTPRCAAKETLDWVQESAMVQYDIDNPVDTNNNGLDDAPEDLIQMAKDLGVKTVYLEELINPLDFTKINPTYNVSDINKILDKASQAGLHVVTDFVPNVVDARNPWYTNVNTSEYFKPGTRQLDYTNPDLLTELAGLVSGTWYGVGVKGFLMPTATGTDEELMKNASITLNEKLKAGGGAVVYGETDVSTKLDSANVYKQFLMEQVDENDWAYFKYNPKTSESTMDPDMVHLVTLSLFMVRGTPILDGFNKEYFEKNKLFIKSLSDFRGKESVQVGNITFADTAEDVIGYARVEKGTPGYAVAVNMNSAPTTVNFTSIEGVPGKGENELKLMANETFLQADLGASQLDSVPLDGYEGIVVQFVPNF